MVAYKPAFICVQDMLKSELAEKDAKREADQVKEDQDVADDMMAELEALMGAAK